jgi:23S rRNA pseudouridine955/2504/2580 synthase
MELITGENDKGRRLDRVLRKALPDYPLPLLHRLLRQGRVLADGKPAKAQDRLDCGVTVRIPPLKNTQKPAPPVSFKKKIASPEVIWQGSGLLAVNKPPGIAVHGPVVHDRTVHRTDGKASPYSLDEMVRSFLAGKLPPSLSFKPGPLHRLDKPSSGIVVFSTNIEGAQLFSSLMRGRKVKKTYLAIVEGSIQNEEIWQDELVRDREKKKTFVSQPAATKVATAKPACEKTAITKVKPLANKGNYTLVTAEIATGRTHQIRAQSAFHGHPLAGDKKYGGRGKDGLFLHAWKLEFLEYLIEAPPPQAFREKAKELFGGEPWQ